MLHIIVENWDSSPPESIASEETVGPPGGRLTPSWRPGVTSPYSPWHGMVWWGGVTSAYLPHTESAEKWLFWREKVASNVNHVVLIMRQ